MWERLHSRRVDRAQEGSPCAGSVAWRRKLLLGSGFPPHLAFRLAAQPGWDLHAAIELVERGCPPHLAARILAPLEGERDRC